MTKNSNVITSIVESFKSNKNAKGDTIRVDINALQGFKFTLSEKDFQTLCDTMRSENLIKGSRGGSSDSKQCKEVRNLWERFLKDLVSKGLASRDEEYYSKTNKTRYVVLDKNNDRIQPSLNMSNVDSKIRKAKEQARENMTK